MNCHDTLGRLKPFSVFRRPEGLIARLKNGYYNLFEKQPDQINLPYPLALRVFSSSPYGLFLWTGITSQAGQFQVSFLLPFSSSRHPCCKPTTLPPPHHNASSAPKTSLRKKSCLSAPCARKRWPTISARPKPKSNWPFLSKRPKARRSARPHAAVRPARFGQNHTGAHHRQRIGR